MDDRSANRWKARGLDDMETSRYSRDKLASSRLLHLGVVICILSSLFFSLLFTPPVVGTGNEPRVQTPTNLTVAVLPSGGALNISWDLSQDSPINYSVYFNVNQNITPIFLLNVTHPTTWLVHLGLLNGGIYSYWVSAWNDTSQSQLNGPVNGTPADSVAPNTPVGFKATPLPEGKAINISWQKNLDDTHRYKLSSNLTGVWDQLLEITHPQNWTILRNLLDGSTFFFRISALDPSTNESPQSTTFSAVTADTMPPPTPVGIDVKLIPEGSSLNITWNPGTYNFSTPFEEDTAFFTVYFNNSGAWEIVGTTSASTTHLLHQGLVNGVLYQYNVTASDEVPNESPPSGDASNVPTDSIPPPRPTIESIPPLTRKVNRTITGGGDHFQKWCPGWFKGHRHPREFQDQDHPERGPQHHHCQSLRWIG